MKFRDYLTEESFKEGDWIQQKRNDATAYALLISKNKNNSFKSIYIDDDRPVAVIKSTKGWFPEPIKIKEEDIPEKLKKKILDKKKKMNF